MEKKISTRKSVVLHEEDSAITLLKPYSGEHYGKLFMINEDAYGEFYGVLTPIDEIRKRLNLSDEEFQFYIDKL